MRMDAVKYIEQYIAIAAYAVRTFHLCLSLSLSHFSLNFQRNFQKLPVSE